MKKSKAIQMSTGNICFYKENEKENYCMTIIKYATHKVLCWSFFKLCLIRWIFYNKFFPVILKTLVHSVVQCN